MISYVECLSGEASSGVTSRCFSPVPESDETDRLLPNRKIPAFQPKTEGSLRRRLLSSRIHQYATTRIQSTEYSNKDNHGPVFTNPAFVPNRRTSSGPPSPEPRPGYVDPNPAKFQDFVRPQHRVALPPRVTDKPRKRRGLFRRRTNTDVTTPLIYKGQSWVSLQVLLMFLWEPFSSHYPDTYD